MSGPTFPAPATPSPAPFFWAPAAPFALEGGGSVPGVRVAYRTWGRLAPDGDNAVLVCHPLTASADVDEWWPGILGCGRSLDPGRDFVICSNVLGGCYGTTGPAAPHPVDGRRWGRRFPEVTVRDMVRLQAGLLGHLGVRRLRLVLGGSLGGLQVLEWLAAFPAMIDAAIVVAASARHSAWCIGWSESQRQAIFNDPKWREGSYPPDDPPRRGLATARAIAMVSYRSAPSFGSRFDRSLHGPGLFAVESYLRYQGEKLADRFDAASYVTLTRAMDSHDVGRGRGGPERVLPSLPHPVLVVGIETDVLYPLAEQELLARWLPGGELALLESVHGHDGFLIDVEPLDRLIRDFRESRHRIGARTTQRAKAPLDEVKPCAS